MNTLFRDPSIIITPFYINTNFYYTNKVFSHLFYKKVPTLNKKKLCFVIINTIVFMTTYVFITDIKI